MKYVYRAKTQQGQEKNGEVEATDPIAAAEILRKERLFITSLAPNKENKFSLGFLDKILNRIKLRDVIIFTQQLAVMLRSGFPLVPALRTLQKQTENKNFAKVIGEVVEDVKGGATLSSSLEKHPDVFPLIYTQIAKSGEQSGKLDKVMERLSSDLTKSYDLNAKIKGALVYPIFILSALVVVVVIIMIFVIPQLKDLFAEVDVTLPLATRVLIGASSFSVHFWWLILIILIGLLFFYQWVQKIPEVRSVIDSIKLRIPIFGQLQKKSYLARFVRTLSTLTAAGLPVLDTFNTLIDLSDNVHFKQDLKDAIAKIESGVPIGESLEQSKNFPTVICEMISVGEQAGNLDYVLKNMAKFLEKDVAYMSKNLTTLLEPILMVVMGVGVAFVLFSVLGPIYNLVQVIK